MSTLDALAEHSFFFTKMERDTLASAKTKAPDGGAKGHSLLYRLLKPGMSLLSSAIPDTVAPNTVSLIGALCALQAFHLTTQYLESDPTRATPVIVVLLAVSALCPVLADFHGSRCRSHSSVGNVFLEMASAVRSVFFAATLVPLYLGSATLRLNAPAAAAAATAATAERLAASWYLVVGMQLLRLCDVVLRVSQKVPGSVVTATYMLTSAELALLQAALICHRWLAPQSPVYVDWVPAILTISNLRFFYNTSMCLALSAVLLLRAPSRSVWPLLICLCSRVIPSFWLPLNDVSALSVLGDAAMIAIVQVEVYASALAQRTAHSAVAVMAVGSIVNAPLAIVGC